MGSGAGNIYANTYGGYGNADATYYCEREAEPEREPAGAGEPDGAWKGTREQKSPAVDRFVLMRAVPQCLPELPEKALRDGADLYSWEADEAGAFLEFFAGVMPFACYRPTEGEEELFEHLRGVLGIAAAESEPEAEPAGDEARGACPIVELAERILGGEAKAEPWPFGDSPASGAGAAA